VDVCATERGRVELRLSVLEGRTVGAACAVRRCHSRIRVPASAACWMCRRLRVAAAGVNSSRILLVHRMYGAVVGFKYVGGGNRARAGARRSLRKGVVSWGETQRELT